MQGLLWCAYGLIMPFKWTTQDNYTRDEQYIAELLSQYQQTQYPQSHGLHYTVF